MEELLEQYHDASKLDSRIKLHNLYSTNKQDWFLWLYEQYPFEKECKVLEIGCGDGTFWSKNEGRIPAHWTITLSDFSAGMVADAQKRLKNLPLFQYEQINIQNIPYEGDSFDVVIANFMLYHVPNRTQALAEVRRVLKPGGVFFAATIGEGHLMELGALLKEFDPSLDYSSALRHAKEFGLENGPAQLKDYFAHVELKCFPDGLKIPEVQPIIDYLLSTNSELKNQLVGQKLEEFACFLEKKKNENDGFITITKSAGLFVAK